MEACEFFTASSFFETFLKISKAIGGALCILAGLLVVLTGKETIRVLAFVGLMFSISVVGFAVAYNTLPFEINSAADGILLSVIVVMCLFVGWYFAARMTQATMDYIPMIFGGWAFVELIKLVLMFIDSQYVKIQSLKLALLIISAFIGFYLGKWMRLTLLCLLSAFVGATLFIQGVAIYAGGLELDSWQKMNTVTKIYLVMGAVLTFIGFLYQRCFLFAHHAESDTSDDFQRADKAKKKRCCRVCKRKKRERQ